jgi:hypothetical protein
MIPSLDAAVVPSTPTLETRTISALFLYQPQVSAYAESMQRWTVRGAVTLVREGDGFFITDEQSGLWVQTPQKITLQLGDITRVSGYATRGARGTYLADAIVTRETSGPPPLPLWHELTDAARPEAEASLASLTGTLTALAQTADEQILYLVDPKGRAFEARLLFQTTLLDYSAGTQLRITGLCQPTSPSKAQALGPLTLLLRNAADLTVLQSASWLNAERAGRSHAPERPVAHFSQTPSPPPDSPTHGRRGPTHALGRTPTPGPGPA